MMCHMCRFNILKPITQTFFSIVIQIWWKTCHFGRQIVTKFCTCHDSTAVLACAKFCNDYVVKIKARAKWTFHWILIVMEKILRSWNGLLNQMANILQMTFSNAFSNFTEVYFCGSNCQKKISICSGNGSMLNNQATGHYLGQWWPLMSIEAGTCHQMPISLTIFCSKLILYGKSIML